MTHSVSPTKMEKRALVIEDDADIANLVVVNLRDINLEADVVSDGREGLQRAVSRPYAVIILDIMLPGLNGIEVCRQLREQQVTVPILMLTSRNEEIDKVLALDLGADDYITKPFGIREFLSRVKARLRRFEQRPVIRPAVYRYGDLVIAVESRRVTLSGKVVDLTAKEFDLLALFMRNPGRAFSRMELLDQVWGYSYRGYEHTVNSHINRLRLKIEHEPARPHYILTVWAIGYKFTDESVS